MHISQNYNFAKAHIRDTLQERLKTIHNEIKDKLALFGGGLLKNEKTIQFERRDS